MQRTWKSSVTRGAQVLSHQNVHTYIILTQRRGSATGNTIGKHNGETKRETTEKNEKWKKIYSFFNLFNCFKILSVYKSKEKMENHRFLWNVFFWRWAQVLSHHFSTIGSRTSIQRRGSATGNTIGKHNGETKRETTEKNEKWKNIFIFFNLFNCFKILSVYKSKEKMENHRFLWNVFF